MRRAAPYRGQQEALAEFLPLDAENWITCGNALRLDWLSVCPPTGTGVKLLGEDLFSTPLDQAEDDVESGTIYVLRSLSDHPFVAEHRDLIHKIGVSGGKVETRIANAAQDATYLLAEVEVVATYKLAAIKRTRLENLFHRIFAAAELDLTIHDRFGHSARAREWFLVPLHAIDDAVDRVRDGSITGVVYDPAAGRVVDQPNRQPAVPYPLHPSP